MAIVCTPLPVFVPAAKVLLDVCAWPVSADFPLL